MRHGGSLQVFPPLLVLGGFSSRVKRSRCRLFSAVRLAKIPASRIRLWLRSSSKPSLWQVSTNSSPRLWTPVMAVTIGAKPNLYCEAIELVCAITKPPLLQESRLTGGGSPNLVVLVEWKVPVERFMGAANCFH